jgi:hypothetical protein
VFGLGSGSYFIGRSHPEALIATFSAWTLALALLTVAVITTIAEHPRRRPDVAMLAVLLGFGLAVCSLAQTPVPWSQIQRLDAPFLPTEFSTNENPFVPVPEAVTEQVVASLADGPSHFVVKRGAPVAILLTNGHRVADAYGVVDVSPYTGTESMQIEERIDAALDALQKAGGNTVIVPTLVDSGVYEVLTRRGFKAVTTAGGFAGYDARTGLRDAAATPWVDQAVTKWVDMNHLHPRALQ